MNKKSGLSLIELLIAIAITGILAAAMIPSISTFLKNQRTQSAAFSLATALRLAKTEAIEHQISAGVCLSTNNDNTACDSGWDASSTEQKNWIVFLDADGNHQFTNTTTDRILKVLPGPTPNSVEFTLGGNIIDGLLFFTPMGFYHVSTTSTITIKPTTGCQGNFAQLLTITATGNVSINNTGCE